MAVQALVFDVFGTVVDWRSSPLRLARGLPGGLPRSPQPLARGYGWGALPVGIRAGCGEAPVGGLA